MAVSIIKKGESIRKVTKSVYIRDGNAEIFDTEVPVISVSTANDGFYLGVPFHREGKTHAKFVPIGGSSWTAVSNMNITVVIEYIDE